ncbi:MAG: hypothetical protein ISR69_06370 [Gammaproteobacteria bacterium]|nr:hypothetical protein [Gammaproteobacteria bacterium]
MKIISSNDINYDNVKALGDILLSHGLNVVSKEAKGVDNARVNIDFPPRRKNDNTPKSGTQ